MAYHLAGQTSPAFVDRGDRIDAHDAADEAAILAALQLSAEKWGAFQSDRQRGLQGPLCPSGGPLWLLHDHQPGAAG
ncbi:MAG: LPD7 domain-containing protein [Burkholderia sp.]